MSRKGYVYVLSNAAMPGLLKIGRSIHGGKSRAKDIYQTGVPTPFTLEFEMLVDCPATVEALVHEKLGAHRASKSREFFRIDVMTAKHAVIECDLGEEEYTICSLDEYEAVEGAALLAHKSNAVWLDVCRLIGWLKPQDIAGAQQRRMLSARESAFINLRAT